MNIVHLESEVNPLLGWETTTDPAKVTCADCLEIISMGILSSHQGEFWGPLGKSGKVPPMQVSTEVK